MNLNRQEQERLWLEREEQAQREFVARKAKEEADAKRLEDEKVRDFYFVVILSCFY